MSSDPRSTGGEVPPEEEFLAEQMARFSKVFGVPLGVDADVERPKKEKTPWFEPPSPRNPLDESKASGDPAIPEASPPVAEPPAAGPATAESAAPPVAPVSPSVAAESEPLPSRDLPAIPELAPRAADHRVVGNAPPENVELPVFSDSPIGVDESDPSAFVDKAESVSILGEIKALWRHLRSRLSP
ncbi:MAG: hypothetical protein ACHQ49_09300 [Elusimicrobiota bacterium]